MELMVNMKNGIKDKVEHVGLLRLPLASRYILDLKDVVFVSSVRRNLISIFVLDKCGYSFLFEN